MKRKLVVVMMMVSLSVLLLSGSLEAAAYKFTDLIYGFPNDPGDYVTGFNNSGQIAGYYPAPFGPSGGGQAYFANLVTGDFVWLQPISEDYPYSQAFGLNNLGQIVGCCSDSQNSVQIPCVWTDPAKAPTKLAVLPNYTAGYAYGINDSGLIVGFSWNPGSQACKWTLTAPDQPVGLATLGGFDSEAHAVNNAGQIVGWASSAQNKQRACLWNAGQTTPQDLASSLPDGMIAKVINNQGHVLVTFYDSFPPSPTGGYPLFYWSQATGPINPCSESFTSNYAAGLSDSDQMTGMGTSQQTSKSWYWTPAAGEKDLNQMIVNLPQGTTITGVTLISPKGHILGWDSNDSGGSSCMLTPIAGSPGISLLLMK